MQVMQAADAVKPCGMLMRQKTLHDLSVLCLGV